MRIIALVSFVIFFFSNPCIAQKTPDGSEVIPAINQAYETEVLHLVNKERAKAGLAALKMDENLTNAARYHAYDMATNNYFDHRTLKIKGNGNSEKVMLTATERIKLFLPHPFSCVGENIATGQPTPEDVIESWMASDGHKENILNPDYTHIGIGYYHALTYEQNLPCFWVQTFRNND